MQHEQVEADTEGVAANCFALALAADLWEQQGDGDSLEQARRALLALVDADRVRVKVWNARLVALAAVA